MSTVVMIAVVLLPIWLYLLALALAACRERLGCTKVPLARCLTRTVRQSLSRRPSRPAGGVD
jgi:hypothetical protein